MNAHRRNAIDYAYAGQRFPATAGGHRFIVPACVVALVCLVVLL